MTISCFISCYIVVIEIVNQRPQMRNLRRSHMNQAEPQFVYHLIEAARYEQTIAIGKTYYPPTYETDGFTHGTSNPEKLLGVANHFYREIEGDWYCLRMTVASLAATGIETVFEGAAPVGDRAGDHDGSDGELFPHLMGGILPAAVLRVHSVQRGKDGVFLNIHV